MRTIVRIAAVAIAVAFVGGSVAHASDWPQIGYDGGHSAYNQDETSLDRATVGSLDVGWWRPMRPVEPDMHGYEYATSVDVVRRGRVFASWNAGGHSRIAAFRETNGHVLWRRSFDFAGSQVLAATATTGLAQLDRRAIGFDPADGQRLWGRFRWRASSADLRDGLVFGRSTRTRTVEALDIRRGDTVWSRSLPGAADPVFSRGSVLVTARGADGRELLALDPLDGTTRWRRPVIGQVELAFGGRVLTTWAADRTDVRLYGPHGRMMWRRSFPSNVWINGAGGGRVYVEHFSCVSGCEGDAWGTYRSVLTALRARDGHTLWRVRGGPGIGQPAWMVGALVPGVVFVSDLNFGPAEIGALGAADGRLLWTTSVGSSTGSNVTAAANGRVYVGTAAGYTLGGSGGRVYAFELP